jgi:hypothetical protein
MLTGVNLGLVMYDYSLTLTSEVERYWLRPTWSSSSVLFYLIRYVTLLGSIPTFFSVFFEHTLMVNKVRGCCTGSFYKNNIARLINFSEVTNIRQRPSMKY